MATKTKTTKKSENKSEKRMSGTEIRAALKQLTDQLKVLHEKGKIAGEKANDWLKIYYAKLGHTDLRTFDEWKAEGYSVIRGEKALHLWTKRHTYTQSTGDGEVTLNSFGYCNLFSRKQVEIRVRKTEESAAAPVEDTGSDQDETATETATETETAIESDTIILPF